MGDSKTSPPPEASVGKTRINDRLAETGYYMFLLLNAVCSSCQLLIM